MMMMIREMLVHREHVPLTRPYVIASFTTSSVEIFYVRVRDAEGNVGYGSASPAPDITDESPEDCATALARAAAIFSDGDGDPSDALAREVVRLRPTPAALAALDMAARDLEARRRGVPLCSLLGKPRDPLPTSVTIGILPVEETLAEAREHIGNGFTRLKVKVGHDIDVDLERLSRLREESGPEIGIRVDANQGYDLDAARRICDAAGRLRLELVEQPLSREEDALLSEFSAEERAIIALDESVLGVPDATRIFAGDHVPGHIVIKLMKCGGVTAATQIAADAERAGVGVMWGCMDESAVSISAALHSSLATPSTRFIDLDGSFDLARDLASGGFTVEHGVLIPNGKPGLGVEVGVFGG